MGLIINQYHGVNPHLNDELQDTTPRPGRLKWEAFHDRYVDTLETFLRRQLRPQGYTVDKGPGLQIREFEGIDPDTSEDQWSRVRSLESDGHVFSPADLQPSASPHAGPDSSRSQLMSLEELAGGKEYYDALKIYRPAVEQDIEGELVGWIEVISPSNTPSPKISREDWMKYLSKRNTLLENGVPVIEVNLGHINEPTIPNQPRYPEDEDSSPHSITVLDPRGMEPGQVNITTYPFGVDQPLPAVNFDLPGGKHATIDFDEVYQRTYMNHYADVVDHLQAPRLLRTYSPEDQGRIAARMETTRHGLTSGIINEKQKYPLPILPEGRGNNDDLSPGLDMEL
ncbi:MAG: DUF4058 family protein [Anaerolineae bacterium]|nr:DUF4058 family protein [Anaerolineae bacterium]